MKPEEKARQEIDKLINLAGWEVQDYNEFNLGAFSWSRLDLIQFINLEFPSRFISQRSPVIPNRLILPIREGICTCHPQLKMPIDYPTMVPFRRDSQR